jgi:hypothetical protein
MGPGGDKVAKQSFAGKQRSQAGRAVARIGLGWCLLTYQNHVLCR